MLKETIQMLNKQSEELKENLKALHNPPFYYMFNDKYEAEREALEDYKYAHPEA